MNYFHGPFEARDFYQVSKSAAEITVAAAFGSAFDADNTAHCLAFVQNLDALLADDERMQFHRWTAADLLAFAYG
ncbi:hypothetical protein QCE62_05670 [Caballeronia sp. LZ033]|uniref:hypothetical protein n=1 Tax=Caballeronia sp. LZ033 TaxID=3038566 RepID=UPI00285C521D|nr:hypothetical protein [Caballeronia sp. LZ033]MDR5813078.1 hypothetical protein [Caballeronia sp. LZ033]